MKKTMQIAIIFVNAFIIMEGTTFGNTWYVTTNSVSDGPGTTWSNAFHTIQGGVDAASSGDTVLVGNGVYEIGTRPTPGYSCLNRVVITNDIVVRSVNGQNYTFIVGAEATGGGNGPDAVRGVYMSAGVLCGFAITNGHTMTATSPYNLGYNDGGGGVNMYGGNGVVSNCIITGNFAYDSGGGSFVGTLNNCTLMNNSAGDGGGGSFSSKLNNCIITGNFAVKGGGIYYGTLNNCIIYYNSAVEGGGSYYGTLNNCIIYYNSALRTGDNYYEPTILGHCCTTPDPGGIGNVTNKPLLVSASHILPSSPCVGAGSTNYAVGTDVDGDAWANPPSIGCDEPSAPFTGSLSVNILASYTKVASGYSVDFTGEIIGEVSSNRWVFGDGTSMNNVVHPSHAWSSPGIYDIVLTAWNDDYPAGVSTSMEVQVADATFFVNVANTKPVSPYASWETAATNIQDAVDLAWAGTVVLVTNGVYNTGSTVTPGYSCSNRVVITNDIAVRSVNGPDYTFIVGSEAPGGGNGSNAVRGVYMSAGLLCGFTITNGHTMTSDNWDYDKNGGGINLYGGNGIVSNCVIIGNSVSKYGGGSSDGTLNNCTFMGNSAVSGGGGSYWCTLNNCTLIGNSASNGDGGGSCVGTLNNCTLIDNSTGYGGGGSYGCTLNNCILKENSASYGGGGSYDGTLNNCILTENSANYGGGSCCSTLNNSTLTGNSANHYGGGSVDSTLYNCIIYYNSAVEHGNNYNGGILTYCCTTPDPGGTGNITNEPEFVNYSTGDFYLQSNSPCIDAGDNGQILSDMDKDSVPLPLDGNNDGTATVDMGCYEYLNNNADSDRDGSYDGDELVADTDPTNSNDWFHITAVSNGVVFFDSSSARLYTLLGCTNLLSGDWKPVQTPRMGIGGVDFLQSTNNLSAEFYKLKVARP